MQWKKLTDDCKPKEYEQVLVWNGFKYLKTYVNGQFHDDDYHWTCAPKGIVHDVTHWMELPEAPLE